MSIIVTHISRHGIIHAADSNLTDAQGLAAGQASKLFPINRLHAALTVAGTYSVGGGRVDTWMATFIGRDTSSDLGSFVAALADSVNQVASQTEKQSGYFLHIAGYTGIPGSCHPEFYHITNYSIDTSTGGYSVLNPYLRFSEGFWSQNSSIPASQLFANGKGYIYCNGFPSGRIAYFTLLQQMASFRSAVWTNTSWSFRPPVSVDEEADYLKHDMELISLLFKHSNYSAPFIGGGIQIYTIKCPYQ